MGSDGNNSNVKINDVKGSKKCLIVGAIVKKNEIAEFKKFVEDEAAKAGEVDGVEVKNLPDAFISADVRSNYGGKAVALIATVQFNVPLGPAKLISAWNGKIYKDFNALFVTRINEKASIDDVIRKIGEPPENFADESDDEIEEDSDESEDSDEDEDSEAEESELFFAYIYGIFLRPTDNASDIFKEISSKVPCEEHKVVNLTRMQPTMAKGDEDKEAYAFSVGFKTFSDRENASEEYVKEAEKLGLMIRFIKTANSGTDEEILEDAPSECLVFNRANFEAGLAGAPTSAPEPVRAFVPTDCDVVVLLSSKMKESYGVQKRELLKVIDEISKDRTVVKQDILFPKQSGSSQDPVMFFRFKDSKEAADALKLGKIKANDEELRIVSGSTFDFSQFDLRTTELEGPMQTKDKIDKKIWQRLIDDAYASEKEGNYEDAEEQFKVIYVDASSANNHRVVCDASSGLASIRIKYKSMESAINGIIADISEIDLHCISPKLVLQLASAFLLRGKVGASVLTCFFGIDHFKVQQNQFEMLLVHISENYASHLETLRNYLKDTYQQSIARMNLRQLAEFANDLRLELSTDSVQLAADKKRYVLQGAIVLDEKLKISFMAADLNSKHELALRHLRAEAYTKAAETFRDALEFTNLFDERCLVQYAYAMSLLASKTLENIKEGQNVLRELYSRNVVDYWQKRFPAIFYGLAKYEIAVKNPNQEFLNYSLEPAEDKDEEISEQQKELAKVFPELNADVGQMLEDLKSEKHEVLAICRYEDCQKIHPKDSVVHWKKEITKEDLDYKGFYSIICKQPSRPCKIDFHASCWKHKKDKDDKRKDKDYLQEWCVTPECGYPICKVIVVKDDPEAALEIKDDKVTDQMMNERETKQKGAVSSPKRGPVKSELGASAAPPLNDRAYPTNPTEDSEDPAGLLKIIENLREQNEQLKADNKILKRDLRNVTSEKADVEKELNLVKDTVKLRNADLRTEKEKHGAKERESRDTIDRLRKDANRARQEKTQGLRDKDYEMCREITSDVLPFRDFVKFMSENLLPNSKELTRLIESLETRFNAARAKKLEQLAKTTIELDYNQLTLDIIDRNKTQENEVTKTISLTKCCF